MARDSYWGNIAHADNPKRFRSLNWTAAMCVVVAIVALIVRFG